MNQDYKVKSFGPEDLDAIRAFVATLPEHDLLFLGRDLRHTRVIDAWMQAVRDGSIVSLVAKDGDRVAGTSAIISDPLSWSAHVGEVRLLVSVEDRGRGVGRILLQETFRIAIERGLRKLIAQMTTDQGGAIALFESLGFRGEAMLRNQVRDRNGEYFDIAMLSHDVSRMAAQMEAFGLDKV